MALSKNQREERKRERDDKYLVINPETGRMHFDSKRAWYDAVAKCNKNQIKEVNRALKSLGINQTMMRVDINKLIEVYNQKRLDPAYGPDIWTISGMLSGSPPTSEDIRHQIGVTRRRKFEERNAARAAENQG